MGFPGGHGRPVHPQAPVDLGAGRVTMGLLGVTDDPGSQAWDLSPETPTGLGQ